MDSSYPIQHLMAEVTIWQSEDIGDAHKKRNRSYIWDATGVHGRDGRGSDGTNTPERPDGRGTAAGGVWQFS